MAERIGVCSWSLRPSTPVELVAQLRAVELKHVQLALDPLRVGSWEPEETRRVLAEGGVEIVSGMMGMQGEDYSSLESIRLTGGLRPDEHWEANRAAAGENAKLARALGLGLVSFHAGFLPEEPDSSERSVLLTRLREVVERFADEGVATAFETGQESAATLSQVLDELDHPQAGVNFDPANMILYDMGEPVEALRQLAPHVRQIHVKDARRTDAPGTWGREVAVGEGEVRWEAFFDALAERGLDCDLIIEREAGSARLGDVRRAARLVRRELARTGRANA